MPVRSPFSCRLCVLSLLYFAVAATGLVTTVASSLSLVRTDRLLSSCCCRELMNGLTSSSAHHRSFRKRLLITCTGSLLYWKSNKTDQLRYKTQKKLTTGPNQSGSSTLKREWNKRRDKAWFGRLSRHGQETDRVCSFMAARSRHAAVSDNKTIFRQSINQSEFF